MPFPARANKLVTLLVYSITMARAAPPLPVSPKMFRHFAVVTMVCTGCIAMFAEGENRQAFEMKMAHKSQDSRLQEAERELAAQGKGGNNRLSFTDNRTRKQTWAPDPPPPREHYVDFMELEQPQMIVNAGYDVPLSLPPGMTLQEYQEMQRRKQQPRNPTPQEVQKLLEQSRMRSGAPEGE